MSWAGRPRRMDAAGFQLFELIRLRPDPSARPLERRARRQAISPPGAGPWSRCCRRAEPAQRPCHVPGRSRRRYRPILSVDPLAPRVGSARLSQRRVILARRENSPPDCFLIRLSLADAGFVLEPDLYGRALWEACLDLCQRVRKAPFLNASIACSFRA
jgi:hypothetical protein